MFFIFSIILLISIIIEMATIGLFFSKIIINVEECDIYKKSNNIDDINVEKIRVSIQIYWFKFLKLLNINIFKTHFEIFGLKIKFNKVFKFKENEDMTKIIGKMIIIIKNNFRDTNIKRLNPNIEFFEMNISLGTENAIFTSFLTTFLSISISFFLKKFMKQYSKNRYKYKIIPNYFNINNFKIHLKTKISFDILKLVKFIYFLKRAYNEKNINLDKNKDLSKLHA